MKNRSGRDVGGALEWWEYGNPEDVLERRQSERCVGCAHAVEKPDPFGGARMICRKAKKYGKRCAQFKEKT